MATLLAPVDTWQRQPVRICTEPCTLLPPIRPAVLRLSSTDGENTTRPLGVQLARKGVPMPRLRAVALIAFMLVARVSAADVSGVWALTVTAEWTTVPELVCTFSQDDEALTGTCRSAGSPADGGVDVTNGRVEGDRVQCQWSVVTPDGQTWTYALMGTLDAGETTMDGTVRISSPLSDGDGRFTARKRPVRVGSVILSLEPSSRVEPVLPDEAAQAGVSGNVVLEIDIDQHGDVSVRDVLRGHPLLHEAARRAVMQWKDEPVELDGIGVVPVIAVVTVSFNPDGVDAPGTGEH